MHRVKQNIVMCNRVQCHRAQLLRAAFSNANSNATFDIHRLSNMFVHFRAPSGSEAAPEQHFRAASDSEAAPEQHFRAPSGSEAAPERHFRAPSGSEVTPERHSRAPVQQNACSSSACASYIQFYRVFSSIALYSAGRRVTRSARSFRSSPGPTRKYSID